MATAYEEEVRQRAAKMAEARKAVPVQPTASPQTNRFLKPGYPVAAGGLAALTQAVSEKDALDKVSADPNATTLDKGAAFGGATARTMGAGAGAMAGGLKGAALGSFAGPVGTAVGGLAGSAIGGYLGSRAADAAIQGGKQAVDAWMDVPQPAQQAPAKPRVMGSSVGAASQSQRGEGSMPGTTQNPIVAKPGESVQKAAKTGGGLGVTRIDKPGESPLFTNIAGGDNMMARGTPSAQNVGAMDALAARYAGGAPAASQPQQPVYGGMASMGTGTNTGGFGILDANYQRERALRMDAADSRNPGESRRAYEARIAGAAGALNAFRGEQTAAPRLAAAQRGTDAKMQADMALASRKMAFDEAQGGARMGLDVLRQTDDAKTNAMRRDATGMEIEKAKALDAARQEYLAAGDDPAKQQAAARKLQVLSGKDNQKEAKWNSVVVGGGTNELGQKVGGTAMLYNESTGEVRPIGEQQAQAGAGPKPTGPATPKTKAEYDALPPGTKYLHSDGTIKIKAGQ